MAVYLLVGGIPPHLRGERGRRSGAQLTDGNTPCLRGERIEDRALPVLSRYTPAGTGRATTRTDCGWTGPVYPRGYGASLPTSYEAIDGAGIPPQVRGEQAIRHGSSETEGHTPAGTG